MRIRTTKVNPVYDESLPVGIVLDVVAVLPMSCDTAKVVGYSVLSSELRKKTSNLIFSDDSFHYFINANACEVIPDDN